MTSEQNIQKIKNKQLSGKKETIISSGSGSSPIIKFMSLKNQDETPPVEEVKEIQKISREKSRNESVNTEMQKDESFDRRFSSIFANLVHDHQTFIHQENTEE